MQVCPPVRKLPVWDLQLSTVWVVLRVRRETKVMNADARERWNRQNRRQWAVAKASPGTGWLPGSL